MFVTRRTFTRIAAFGIAVTSLCLWPRLTTERAAAVTNKRPGRPTSAHAKPHPVQPPPALHASSSTPTEMNSYFAVVGSFKTAPGAMRHLRDLRRRDIGADVAVYPPYYRLQAYWTVVSAAYASRDEAKQHAGYARTAWRQQDAFVRRLPPGRSVLPRSYNVYPLSVAMAEYPNFLVPPSPGNSSEPSQFVFVGSAATEDEGNDLAAKIRQRFPGIHVALFPPRQSGDPWQIAIAAHASAEQAQNATVLAERLNLTAIPTKLGLAAADAFGWAADDKQLTAQAREFRIRVQNCFRDGSVTMGDMRACARAWVTPQTLTACLGTSDGTDNSGIKAGEECVAIPDTPEGALLIARRGLSAVTPLSLQVSNYFNITDADLSACVVQAQNDQTRLQQCMLPRLFTPTQRAALDCLQKGSQSAVADCIRQSSISMVGPGGESAEKTLQCLDKSDGTFSGMSSCFSAETNIGLQQMQKFQNCTVGITSQEQFVRQCLPEIEIRTDVRAKCALEAGTDPVKLKRCAVQQISGGQELLQIADCAKAAGNDPIKLSACVAPETGSVGGALGACLATGKKSATSFEECLGKTDSRFAAVNELRTCAKGVTKDPIALVRTCGNKILPPESQDLAVCLLTKGGDPATALGGCGALPANAQEIADMAGCVQKAGSSPTALSRCLVKDRPNYTDALETAMCVSNAGTAPSGLAKCAAKHVGGTVGDVSICLAQQSGSKLDPVKCVGAVDPRLADAQKVYNCVQSAGSAGSLVANCTNGLVDKKSQQAIDCVSRAGGDRAALATCAASALLPGEAGRLAGCAATSQGAASFAVCAVAPSVNEEFRIAAECASTTGGQPVAFAGCTGGRLTVRELTKCIGGKIGEDCFGPNNTIRKYYENLFNDLTHGPGPNNEIVKAIKVAGDAIHSIGAGLDHVGTEINKEANRRAENAKERLSKPLESPGKTLGCIITFGNSCN